MTSSPLDAAVDLPLGLEAARLARRTVVTQLQRWRVDDEKWTDDAVLVTSELVSNAVRHGGVHVRLSLRLDAGRLRIAVSDGSSGLPAPRRVPQEESGRGLTIVAALAASWGVEVAAGGKAVWALLDVPARVPAAPVLDGDVAPA